MEENMMDIDQEEGPSDLKGSAADADPPPQTPKKIQPLDQDVVNKIAAGEIIVAPMHALKELIENSVDAGATSVEILVKEGGLKLLQITDNGHGIDSDDLPILCERFTTSKIKAFEDLTAVSTYGFRGEALASISHIAHLTVTTKTAVSSCAWKVHYRDGKLVPAKPGQTASPRPAAGRGGTQITVEDLFYNVPTRRRAFRSSSEEYAKILDVLSRYAVHRTGVAFSCRKHGDSGISIATSADSSTLDRIRQIHGSAVASELISFEVDDHKWGCRASGWATNANYHTKRTTILLFINHRSVESSAVRKAIEQTYSAFLPKGGHPWVYLDLEIEPHRVDVNIHPTKREVNFLNEDEIIESICDAIRGKLATVDSSRAFMTQTLLPGIPSGNAAPGDGAQSTASDQDGKSMGQTPSNVKRPYENSLVRTDAKMRKITSMLPPNTQQPGTEVGEEERPFGEGVDSQYQSSGREPVHIRLASVKSLRAEVRAAMHNGLTEVFASLTYVGLVDERRRIAAIQSGVKLFLVDYGMVCSEFFYQVGLTDFGNFGVINLESSPKLSDLIALAAASERDGYRRGGGSSKTSSAGQEETSADSTGNGNGGDGINDDHQDIDINRITSMVATHLIERREMLDEYFSLSISEDGCLLSIPILLKGYTPSLAKLPRFLLRLGPYVDWTSEEACFRTFLRELALFYTPEQLPPPPSSSPPPPSTSQKRDENSSHNNGTDDTEPMSQLHSQPEPQVEQEQGKEQESTQQTDNNVINRPQTHHDREDESITRRREQLSRMLEHVLFPALRSRLVGTNDLVRGVVEVADLKGLYRVFERC